MLGLDGVLVVFPGLEVRKREFVYSFRILGRLAFASFRILRQYLLQYRKRLQISEVFYVNPVEQKQNIQ